MIGIENFERERFRTLGDTSSLTTQWFFRVRAANGQIVAQSEAYASKAAREKGVRALRRALLPGTRDAEAMAKAWRDGADLTNGYETEYTPKELDEANPYRQEVPRRG